MIGMYILESFGMILFHQGFRGSAPNKQAIGVSRSP